MAFGATPPIDEIARQLRYASGGLALRSGRIAVRRPTDEAGRAATEMAAAHRDALSAYLAAPLRDSEWTPTPFQDANLISEVLNPSSDAHLALVLSVPHYPAEAWQSALGRVIAHHDLLRTKYVPAEKGFRAITGAEAAVDWAVLPLGAPPRDASAVLNEIQPILDEPLDLSRCVGRVCLFTAGDGEDAGDVLAIVLHHVAADYRGLEVLAEDLEAAMRLSDSWQPPAVEAHYLDFAAEEAWSRRQPEYADRIAHVVDRLGGSRTHVTVRPVGDHDESTERRPLVLTRRISGDISDRARKLAVTCGTTVYTVVLEAVSRALLEFVGAEDFVLGCAASCRDRAEWNRVVGDFVNIMPVPIQWSDADPVQRVKHFQEVLDVAFEDRGIAFSEVVSQLRPPRVGTSPPLCQITFSWHRRSPSSSVRTTQFEPLLSEQRGTPSDLMIAAVDDGSGFDIRLHARGSEQLERHLEGLHQLIEAELAGRPATAVEDTVTAGETIPSQEALTAAQCLARFATSDPESLAYVGSDGSLTYRQLADRVATLAGRIEADSPSPARVGVLVGRTANLVVAELAASWVGAAFVPVDPSWPAARVRRVLAASQPNVVVTDADIETWQAGGWATVALGPQDVGLANETSPAPMALPTPMSAEATAYIIFTSGSTGEPKGVEIPVGALANFGVQMRLALGLSTHDRVAAFASCGFDASIFELVAPVLVGATVVLAHEGLALDTGGVLRFLAEHSVTFFPATPSLMRLMLENGWEVPISAQIISMGEALDARLASRLVRLTPKLWDLYGPTEATVWATARELPTDSGPHDVMLLGAPLANAAVAILNGHGRPVLPGVVGELCIFGAGLATGYFRQPELTSARFPTTRSGTRYYRTGDLASRNGHGQIRLHGRSDLQVKVSGHRLELGEIESALLSQPDITNACVVALRDGERAFLAALVEAAAGVSGSSVRRQLQSLLPTYAVPNRIELVPGLPLTPSGKVDRQRVEEVLSQSDDLAPLRDADDSGLLRSVWSEVLGHGDFDSTSDFFVVGGTSLQAIDLTAALSRGAGLEVRPQAVFAHPTFAEQLAWFEPRRVSEDSAPTSRPVLPSSVTARLPQVNLREVRTVLLTGATGFLGAHLVDYLAGAGARVVCLVRAGSDAEATGRLTARLSHWGIDPERFPAGAVTALVGDLADPEFALPADLPAVDAMVHSAATVNLLLPASALHQVNVAATMTLAEAAIARGVPFHYVSTYSVLDPSRPSHSESWGVPIHPYLGIPYVRTKWEAEELLNQLAQRGARVSVYRPSRVIGNAVTGASNQEDLFNLVLDCVRDMGSAPAVDLADNFIPVDEVAEAIGARVIDHSGVGSVHNTVSPRWLPWSAFVTMLNELGDSISIVGREEWMHLLGSFAGQPGRERYRPLHSFLQEHLAPYRDLGLRHPATANLQADPAGVILGRATLDARYLGRCLEWTRRGGMEGGL